MDMNKAGLLLDSTQYDKSKIVKLLIWYANKFHINLEMNEQDKNGNYPLL